MTVARVYQTARYEGYAADVKPVLDPNTDATISKGSTFKELDTGRVAEWDGYRWVMPDDANANLQILNRLDTIAAELKSLRELHTAVLERLYP